jgi:hypothetical protein
LLAEGSNSGLRKHQLGRPLQCWLMSALPPKADIDRRDGHVRLVQKRTLARLFDHLIGRDEQVYAERHTRQQKSGKVTKAK